MHSFIYRFCDCLWHFRKTINSWFFSISPLKYLNSSNCSELILPSSGAFFACCEQIVPFQCKIIPWVPAVCVLTLYLMSSYKQQFFYAFIYSMVCLHLLRGYDVVFRCCKVAKKSCHIWNVDNFKLPAWSTWWAIYTMSVIWLFTGPCIVSAWHTILELRSDLPHKWST